MSNRSIATRRYVRHAAMGLCMLMSTVLVHAQSVIEAVTGSVQGGVEVVRIELSKAPTAVPNGFSIQSPARIALDFPGVSNGTGKSNVEVNQGKIGRAHV